MAELQRLGNLQKWRKTELAKVMGVFYEQYVYKISSYTWSCVAFPLNFTLRLICIQLLKNHKL